MPSYPTPHINAAPEDIAKTVLMPGDPKRSEYIAKTFFDNAVLFNDVRGVKGYTGYYNGKRISVMASGMGIPSIGIYSYELYNVFGVENIIRVGSCGTIARDINLRDVVIAMGACTDSGFEKQFELNGSFAPIASYSLLEKAVKSAKEKNKTVRVGNVLSTDIFYDSRDKTYEKWSDMGVLAVEMESAALYMNAAKAKKNALGIFTVSDNLFTHEGISSAERETAFNDMIEIALDTAIN